MATLLTASFSRGVVAHRWLTVFSAMIEKISGIPLINKLRVIHLFDCLWTLGLGVIWSHRLLPHAECHGTIKNEGQWGSRKGRHAIDCVAIKEFTYKIARYTHTDLVTLDTDAKLCYDGIVMAYALLRCKQLRLPDPATKAFGAFLDQAQYHIKTQIGASDRCYTSGNIGFLQHGPSQRSLEGPPLWVIVCSGPMDALCERFTGLRFDDPDLVCHVCSIIQGFMEDVGLATNNFRAELQHTTSHKY